MIERDRLTEPKTGERGKGVAETLSQNGRKEAAGGQVGSMGRNVERKGE